MMHNTYDLDFKAREEALDYKKSYIIQAPAGSGKTELLIQRMLTLLSRVNDPEEVLAITFTKKAANEMRLRLLKTLKSASNPKPQQSHEKKTWELANEVLVKDKKCSWRLLANPNRLRIQTIDSLCSYLTKQLPILSKFGAEPSICQNPQAMYSKAVEEVLLHVEENLSWSKDISLLLFHLDNNLNRLHDLLVTLLAKRDQWLAYIHFDWQDDQLRKSLENNLTSIIEEYFAEILSSFPKPLYNEFLAIANYTGCLKKQSLPGCKATDKGAWIQIAKLLLTQKSQHRFEWRKKPDSKLGFISNAQIKNKTELTIHTDFKKRYKTLMNAFQEYPDFKNILSDIFSLPDAKYTDEQWQILQSLIHVLKILCGQLWVNFKEKGQIDFIENAQSALHALGTEDSPTDLALALDYQIKHILVDEFQDTANSQYQLIEKLTMGWEPNDGRTLFIVGDPMQSIYRFREAEVGLFIRMRDKGINQLQLNPLNLKINFRSQETIVNWNNALFSNLFPKQNHIATGAVSFSSSICMNKKSQEKSEIKLYSFIEADEDEQSNAVIRSIQSLRKDFQNESIAILVRSRSQLHRLLPNLKKNNIPFQAIDIDPLTQKQCIQDLFSLINALIHLGDRVAWLSILRAPWAGLSLHDLFLLAKNEKALIWNQILNYEILGISSDGKIRLNRIIPVLKQAIEERNRLPLRYWLEKTWIQLGGPVALKNRLEFDYVKTFFELVDNLQNQTTSFNLELLRQSIDDLYANPKTSDASLQIMTIHNAKGLEFDTVILPHLEKIPPNQHSSLLSWIERPLLNNKSALLLAPIPKLNEEDNIYNYIKKQQKIKTDFESDRIFYVATTRAKKRLYLFFNQDIDLNQVNQRSFLGKIKKYIKNDPNVITQQNNTSKFNPSTLKEIPFIRVTENWRNPIEHSRTKPLSIYHQENSFKLKNVTPSLFGQLVHRLLQNLSDTKDWWLSSNSSQQKIFIQLQLKQYGILQSNEKYAQDIIAMISNVLKDERGQWILSKHDEAQSEFALTGMIDGKMMNVIIDRTFVSNGFRWIIDYKTTTFNQIDLDIFLQKEQKKYFKQLEKYAKILSLKENKPIKLGLYFPFLSAWHEWEIPL